MLENDNLVLSLAPQNNVFLIDWLTVVFHDVSVSFVQSLLGMNDPSIPWETQHAFRNGYPCRTSYGNITILWGADDERFYKSDETKSASEKVRHDMGICLDMSGQGCRQFENIQGNDWLKFLHEICDRDLKTNITRLDIAYDDHIGTLDLYRIAQDVQGRYYTSAAKKAKLLWSDDQKKDIQGLTVQIGSDSSDVKIRIYDKAAEREFGEECHWIRCEIELRHDRCIVAAAEILKHQHVGRTAAGILRNYLMFREPQTEDTNRSRWPVADYWDKVLMDMERVRLWISPGEPYNFSKTQLHMMKQYGQALITIHKTYGLIPFLMDCMQLYPELKPKYDKVIAEHQRQREVSRTQKPRMVAGELTDLNEYNFEYWLADTLFGENKNE